MTLSSWIRDYVCIPLGGARRSRARAIVNILVTFLLAGLWHGAASAFSSTRGRCVLLAVNSSECGISNRLVP
ncbi:MAG: hypothetical protein IH961_04640 [Chloroflexi bacterium]|nr:hypothetical protein [Chloroflexota bacterium]